MKKILVFGIVLLMVCSFVSAQDLVTEPAGDTGDEDTGTGVEEPTDEDTGEEPEEQIEICHDVLDGCKMFDINDIINLGTYEINADTGRTPSFNTFTVTESTGQADVDANQHALTQNSQLIKTEITNVSAGSLDCQLTIQFKVDELDIVPGDTKMVFIYLDNTDTWAKAEVNHPSGLIPQAPANTGIGGSITPAPIPKEPTAVILLSKTSASYSSGSINYHNVPSIAPIQTKEGALVLAEGSLAIVREKTQASNGGIPFDVWLNVLVAQEISKYDMVPGQTPMPPWWIPGEGGEAPSPEDEEEWWEKVRNWPFPPSGGKITKTCHCSYRLETTITCQMRGEGGGVIESFSEDTVLGGSVPPDKEDCTEDPEKCVEDCKKNVNDELNTLWQGARSSCEERCQAPSRTCTLFPAEPPAPEITAECTVGAAEGEAGTPTDGGGEAAPGGAEEPEFPERKPGESFFAWVGRVMDYFRNKGAEVEPREESKEESKEEEKEEEEEAKKGICICSGDVAGIFFCTKSGSELDDPEETGWSDSYQGEVPPPTSEYGGDKWGYAILEPWNGGTLFDVYEKLPSGSDKTKKSQGHFVIGEEEGPETMLDEGYCHVVMEEETVGTCNPKEKSKADDQCDKDCYAAITKEVNDCRKEKKEKCDGDYYNGALHAFNEDGEEIEPPQNAVIGYCKEIDSDSGDTPPST